MAGTLLIRIEGPMQSWGTESRFDIRDTRREPSKSGVIGLLCAALGKPRHEAEGADLPTLAALCDLRMGVRVDREGLSLVDYHTAGGTHRAGDKYGVIRASGKGTTTVQSQRHYLSDASFVVGLEGDWSLLTRLDQALAVPKWVLFLGRKSFVPSVPVRFPDLAGAPSGLVQVPLEEALLGASWSERPGRSPHRLIIEVLRGKTSPDSRHDVPLDFETRRFGVRYVRTDFLSVGPDDVPV
jgi:CRISPR system Cascade subunit CasD